MLFWEGGQSWEAGSWAWNEGDIVHHTEWEANEYLTSPGLSRALSGEGALVSHGCHNKGPQYCSLKQQAFIILQFWRSAVQNEFHWGKLQVSARLAPSGSCREKNVSWPLPPSRGHQPSLAHYLLQMSFFISLPPHLTFSPSP